MRRVTLLFLLAFISLMVASCSDSKVDPGPTLENAPFPSFAYVFSGSFTVDGEPGPAGTHVFARMGGTYAEPAAAPRDGTYNNIIIGPSHERVEDMKEPIKFYIGSLDGPAVEAEETYDFKVVGSLTNVELDLTFPRMP